MSFSEQGLIYLFVYEVLTMLGTLHLVIQLYINWKLTRAKRQILNVFYFESIMCIIG
jgi:hypothetical protein